MSLNSSDLVARRLSHMIRQEIACFCCCVFSFKAKIARDISSGWGPITFQLATPAEALAGCAEGACGRPANTSVAFFSLAPMKMRLSYQEREMAAKPPRKKLLDHVSLLAMRQPEFLW